MIVRLETPLLLINILFDGSLFSGLLFSPPVRMRLAGESRGYIVGEWNPPIGVSSRPDSVCLTIGDTADES